MSTKTFVVGVGMTKFERPGSVDWDYPDMGKIAAEAALSDAGLSIAAVDHGFVGFVHAPSTAGQRTLYQLGHTGLPVINTTNACATGSSALYLARNFVKSGLIDCALVLGFEKMAKGSPSNRFLDRTQPLDRHYREMAARHGMADAPKAAQIFGNAGREYMERYGVSRETVAKIAEKNHRHSADNPNAQFRDVYTLEEILASPDVHDPLTKLQCCPTSDGAAAAVVASERFVHQHGLEATAVEIVGQGLVTDGESTFDGSDMSLAGYHMSEAAARLAYEESGLGPEDAQVVELHDCFSTNELITYQALGLCTEGKAGQLIDEGATTHGGRWVVNPSGGLISKGHPIGATGLAQCAELNWQLRGQAAKRQVPGANVGLQHNLGLGGAVVVTMYRMSA
jgi:acetyl-CoA acetyltransferase